MRRTVTGFTLIELLIVLVIMSVLSAIAVPRIDYGRYRADAAAYTVRNALQMAHRKAVQRQHAIVVSFDLAGGRIRILEDADNDAASTAGERVTWQSLETGADFAAPPAGVAGGTPAAALGLDVDSDGWPSVVFQRNGAASADVELYLRSSYRGRDHRRALTVRRSTGRVDLFRHDGTTWQVRAI